VQCLEPARDDTRAQHLPSRHRHSDALHLDGAEIAVFEEIADQPARTCGDDDRTRLGQCLQTGGEVGRFADDRLFLCRALTDQVTDHDQPGGDPDARLQFDGFDIETTDSIGDTQPRPDRTFGIVLMCSRVAEIDQHAVAHVFGDKSIHPDDDFSDSAMVSSDDLAQILGIEPRREFGRAGQVAEHHRQLPALRFHPHPSLPRRRGRVREGAAAEGGDG
jgi:hypothetical protein